MSSNSPPPSPSLNPTDIPIIDSHIHLYPSSEVSTLAWSTPSHALSGQHSLSEFAAATSLPASLEGFIFIETDRKNDLSSGITDGSGWEFPLQEVDWLKRIATGTPRAGEGHTAAHMKLCKGIIPWAPLPSGVDALQRYVQLVRERAGDAWPLVKGFRYLVQDKPSGTMLTEDFVQGLRWLGREGFTFDVGIDAHQQEWQLEECVEMFTRAHEGVEESEKVVFVLNHICKADLTPAGLIEDTTCRSPFDRWRTAIYKLSRFTRTYIKLSGCFSEIPSALQTASAHEILLAIQPWLIVILATFGPFRIMFGSDWPVCTLGIDKASGGPEDEEGGKGAWRKWRDVVSKMSELAGLNISERVMLWSGAAMKAYSIEDS